MRIYFVDLDGVVVEQGTKSFLPGAHEKLKKLSHQGEIYYFSCWAFTDEDIEWLKNIPGVRMAGYIRKPLGEEYIYIDDKLNIVKCDTKL